ncbi:methyltransferase domain-containing protein [Frigoribacterium sp. Leaf186]|uniref:methyltransferase domain-containing protein n=1 Tax=Frigoribacterium sp. Leaf186 TaxID=1736293 RepID=UPI000B1A730E|nr:methyltransferase domain-containing protein [Frigoribacterium sp. Leaf186]
MSPTRASSVRSSGHRPPRWPDLSRRGTDLVELMDDPDCDLTLLNATYRAFPVVNGLVAGWRRVYRRRLRPLLSTSRTTRLLDLGSGGGDLARALAGWARRDGLALDVVAVDPDARAHAFSASRPTPPGVEFRRASSSELVAAGETFDVVVSNHVLHHLDDAARAAVLDDSTHLATRLAVHADIERGRGAYLAYRAATRPWRSRSFVHVDGLLSIRRSFTAPELAAVAPAGWRVVRQRPYRLLLVHEPGTGRGRAGGAAAAPEASAVPGGGHRADS